MSNQSEYCVCVQTPNLKNSQQPEEKQLTNGCTHCCTNQALNV